MSTTTSSGARAANNVLPIKRAVEFEMLPKSLSVGDRLRLRAIRV